VEKGMIVNLEIFGDFFVNKDLESLINGLLGQEHQEEKLLVVLQDLKSSEYFNAISEEELLEAFF
jgi:lipoate-protein ligase A